MSIVDVDCQDLTENPQCPHGPMVKFTKKVKGSLVQFYGCSACRNPLDCPFSLKIGESFTPNKLRAIDDARRRLAPPKTHREAVQILEGFKKLPNTRRRFCKSCFELVSSKSHSGHDLVVVTDKMLEYPLQLLSAKTNDKREAQYWFDDVTRRFVVSLVKVMDFDAVLCLGTPSVFENVRNSKMSMLLDIDPRYVTFYNEEEFGWFNMMNFHFLSDAPKKFDTLKRLMKSGKVCVFIDPPFGVRLEILARTVQKLKDLGDDVTFFLALPYFMEPRVRENFSGFEILDYVVHYENQAKMKSHKKSVVRFFTDATPSRVRLPESEGYRFCRECGCWRHPDNVHCDACGTCPSKNGSRYKHCAECSVCVKSTWEHCGSCGRCFLAPHKCHDNPLLKRKIQDVAKKKMNEGMAKNKKRKKIKTHITAVP